MAALTDLTWQQLAEKLPTGAITVANGAVKIDATIVNNSTIDDLSKDGVVKFFSALFTAANKAQIEINQSQVDGEKLTAFSSATIGTTADGYVTLTRPFVCRSELTSATNIIGSNG